MLRRICLKKAFTVAILVGIYTLNIDAQRWQDRSLSDDERIDALISAMNVEEKISMLGNDAIPRLGIRGSGSTEAIHGVVLGGPANNFRRPQPTSSFPQAYGLGQTWDRDLMHLFGEQMAIEARSLYQNPKGSQGGLVLWAPNADIGRDPRWGRTEECFGEDPTLIGALATAMIQGMQGPDSAYWRASSLMKHFLANSNEDDRSHTSSDFSERQWREYYSYGFMKGFTEGGAESYMAAYNAYNGVPCTVHPMLKEIVANEWDVKGTVTTDGGAFGLLMTQHHYFDDLATAAAACIHAGINRFLDNYSDAVHQAYAEGLITEADLDAVIRGRIYVLLRLGLLDNPCDTANPYLRLGVETTSEPWNLPETKALVRRATDESIVLLKNYGLLPLDTTKIKSILVIGNRADSVYQDWYGGEMPYRVSPLAAIKEIADRNGIKVVYHRYNDADQAVKSAKEADVVIACVGNHPITATDYDTTPPWGKGANLSDGREEVDRMSLQLDTEDMLRLVHRANPNLIVALISSFPYTINWCEENVPAILHATHGSQELGHGITDVLFGIYNPAGRLSQTWPKTITDLPDLMDYDIEHGRTYMYGSNAPLYPFGHGLSYSRFDYGKPTATLTDDSLIVEFDLTNASDIDGDEVPQLYVVIPGDNAQKRLKAFDRIHIGAGKTVRHRMIIPLKDLRLWDEANSKWQLNNGTYTLQLGASSSDIRRTVKVNVNKVS